MDLLTTLDNLTLEFQKEVEKILSLKDLEELRIAFLGRKGRLAQIMGQLSGLEATERPKVGQKANFVKETCHKLLEERKCVLENKNEDLFLQHFDESLPGRLPWQGSLHPDTLVIEEICDCFHKLGFSIASGPEVETDHYNFELLNIPQEHPARDMQDSLYISDRILMRTHTSPVQARSMLAQKPPLAIVAPGKVYRRDSDLTHTPMFHQVEGLLVDYGITMAHLRGVLTAFVRTLFGSATAVRFRPSFFPFTEPSAEVDISCFLCGGSGSWQKQSCRVCKGTGWVEILGCGMVDPDVFTAVDYPEDVTGFAFGLGVERIAMLKYGIEDLRIFFENDLRFLRQFN